MRCVCGWRLVQDARVSPWWTGTGGVSCTHWHSFNDLSPHSQAPLIFTPTCSLSHYFRANIKYIIYFITWKNFDTGVKTKFFANLFHFVKHSFKCLCEEGFYWSVTRVDYIKIKYQGRWISDFQSSIIFLNFKKFYLFIGCTGSSLQRTDSSLMRAVLVRGSCSSIVVCGLLVVVMASLVGEHGL